jgi:hypothetical protein
MYKTTGQVTPPAAAKSKVRKAVCPQLVIASFWPTCHLVGRRKIGRYGQMLLINFSRRSVGVFIGTVFVDAIYIG